MPKTVCRTWAVCYICCQYKITCSVSSSWNMCRMSCGAGCHTGGSAPVGLYTPGSGSSTTKSPPLSLGPIMHQSVAPTLRSPADSQCSQQHSRLEIMFLLEFWKKKDRWFLRAPISGSSELYKLHSLNQFMYFLPMQYIKLKQQQKRVGLC